ncbi:hypothetical protein [Halalkalicoccus ordinarius]|uniref:hypothetical protein n=1 Tax=Halalkalicoccus ordinarius TaxID=3116651 RepID=UPI00300F05F0
MDVLYDDVLDRLEVVAGMMEKRVDADGMSLTAVPFLSGVAVDGVTVATEGDIAGSNLDAADVLRPGLRRILGINDLIGFDVRDEFVLARFVDDGTRVDLGRFIVLVRAGRTGGGETESDGPYRLQEAPAIVCAVPSKTAGVVSLHRSVGDIA